MTEKKLCNLFFMMACVLTLFSACTKVGYNNAQATTTIPVTIIGKWRYINAANPTGGNVAPLNTSDIYLQFNSDSTYNQTSTGSGPTVCSGKFHVSVVKSVIDNSMQPGVSFTTTNSFNADTWDKTSIITIKDDTLKLTSNGYQPHGGPTIAVFKLSN